VVTFYVEKLDSDCMVYLEAGLEFSQLDEKNIVMERRIIKLTATPEHLWL